MVRGFHTGAGRSLSAAFRSEIYDWRLRMRRCRSRKGFLLRRVSSHKKVELVSIIRWLVWGGGIPANNAEESKVLDDPKDVETADKTDMETADKTVRHLGFRAKNLRARIEYLKISDRLNITVTFILRA